MRGSLAGLIFRSMKAQIGLLAACVAFLVSARAAPAQVVFSFGSGYCAPSYYPWYGAITAILASHTTATTRATTAIAGEATIGLGGAIGTTVGILWRVVQARLGWRTRLAWRRMAPPSLTRSLGYEAQRPTATTHRDLVGHVFHLLVR
jgi:hypothetical protein